MVGVLFLATLFVMLRTLFSTAVFDGMLLEFSLLLRLQPAAEHNLITALTRGDKFKVER